jgi:hypothetical protein
MGFYIIDNKVYKASTIEEAKELLKTTKRGRRIYTKTKPIEIGKTYTI